MGVSLGVDLSSGMDLSKLEVTFGGFSPMVMGDPFQTLDKAAEAEERLRLHRESAERAAALEAARASEPREARDAAGNLWRYVVLDGAEVRLERCTPAVEDLIIPEELAGLPVVALAADACAHLTGLRSVVVPDSVVSIGYCAFRNCTGLERAVLPGQVAEFDPGWLRNCPRLEELVLPGRLDCIRSHVFDNAGLRRLRIGAGTREVYPGAFGKGNLQQILIDPENPFLETDGVAVYSKGREVLHGLAVAVPEYDVAPECRMVARKAADGMRGLVRVGLPDGVEVIAEHAFAHTGISRFAAPRRLRAILERAFFDCGQLAEVQLGSGLERIGDNAFTRTGLTELVLPGSIERLGHPVAAETRIRYAGPRATLRIREGGALAIDEQGALLRECEDGLHLEWLVDPQAEVLRVPDGVVRIDARALLNHRALREVQMADTVREVGEAAFKGCQQLRRVELSAGLRRIGDEAFLDTNIEELALPAGLESIGMMALVTQGPHSGRRPTALRRITVDAANDRFSVECGMLMERAEDGRRRVLHYLDEQPDVAIPDAVVSVAPYAFGGARNLRSLRIKSSLADIGMRAFAVDCLILRIHIDMDEPVEGHAAFDICFPETDRGEHQQFVALTSEGLGARSLMEHYDSAIANASSFDAVLNRGGLSLYDQARRIIARLQDPIFLTPVNRQLLERIVRQQLAEVCVAMAKHDDRAGLDALADLGFLTAENLGAVIDRVGAVQDAAMTGYLLEMRRRRFGGAALDFDL